MDDASILKLFDRLAKTDLLIIDDFGLIALERQPQADFLGIIENRYARRATTIANQRPVGSWFDIFGKTVIADAILDRIVHSSHRFDLKGKSLRKKL
jgi:DNA replication protein DnaC